MENGTRPSARPLHYLANTSTEKCTHNPEVSFGKSTARSHMKIDGCSRSPSIKSHSFEQKSTPRETGSLAEHKLVTLCSKVGEVMEHMKDVVMDMKEKNVEIEMESEWKKIALMMDKLFLRLYTAMLVISHVTILAIAVMTSSIVEPHSEHKSSVMMPDHHEK